MIHDKAYDASRPSKLAAAVRKAVDMPFTRLTSRIGSGNGLLRPVPYL